MCFRKLLLYNSTAVVAWNRSQNITSLPAESLSRSVLRGKKEKVLRMLLRDASTVATKASKDSFVFV